MPNQADGNRDWRNYGARISGTAGRAVVQMNPFSSSKVQILQGADGIAANRELNQYRRALAIWSRADL
jgi:hypothetical protein